MLVLQLFMTTTPIESQWWTLFDLLIPSVYPVQMCVFFWVLFNRKSLSDYHLSFFPWLGLAWLNAMAYNECTVRVCLNWHNVAWYPQIFRFLFLLSFCSIPNSVDAHIVWVEGRSSSLCRNNRHNNCVVRFGFCVFLSVFVFVTLTLVSLLCLFINVNKPNNKDDFHENLPSRFRFVLCPFGYYIYSAIAQ